MVGSDQAFGLQGRLYGRTCGNACLEGGNMRPLAYIDTVHATPVDDNEEIAVCHRELVPAQIVAAVFEIRLEGIQPPGNIGFGGVAVRIAGVRLEKRLKALCNSEATKFR